MKKVILGILFVSAISLTASADSKDGKAKKEAAKTESCCTKDAKSKGKDAKSCCKEDVVVVPNKGVQKKSCCTAKDGEKATEAKSAKAKKK